jgi:hypothetical protein
MSKYIGIAMVVLALVVTGCNLGGSTPEQQAQAVESGALAAIKSADGQQAIKDAVGVPNDLVRKGDFEDFTATLPTSGTDAFERTKEDTLWATVKDPKTGEIDSAMVIKTRTQNLWDMVEKLDKKGVRTGGSDPKLLAEVAALRKQVAEIPKNMAVSITGQTPVMNASYTAPTTSAGPRPAPQLLVSSNEDPHVVMAQVRRGSDQGNGPVGLTSEELAQRATMPSLCWLEQRPDADGKLVTYTVVAAEAVQATGPGPYYVCGSGRFSWSKIESGIAQAIQQDPNGNLSRKGVWKGFQIARGNPDNPDFCPIAEDFEGRLGTFVQWEPRFKAEFVPANL